MEEQRSYKPYSFKISGVSFANDDGVSRQKVIKKLRTGEKITAKREYHNPHDEYAIALFSSRGHQIGFIPDGMTESYYDVLDRGLRLDITVKQIYWVPEEKIRGVEIEVTKFSIPKRGMGMIPCPECSASIGKHQEKCYLCRHDIPPGVPQSVPQKRKLGLFS